MLSPFCTSLFLYFSSIVSLHCWVHDTYTLATVPAGDGVLSRVKVVTSSSILFLIAIYGFIMVFTDSIPNCHGWAASLGDMTVVSG